MKQKSRKRGKAKRARKPAGWGGGNKTVEQENQERKAWLASLSEEEYEQLQRKAELALRREPAIMDVRSRA